MRGAPARAIEELAGHQDLQTTQRDMHLSPAALDAAIQLLEDSAGPSVAGAGPAEAGHYRSVSTPVEKMVEAAGFARERSAIMN